jgi:hypothetical protein
MRALRPLRETTYLRVEVHVTAYVAPAAAVADAPQRYIRHTVRTCGRASTACVVPEPGAFSASHELPSRYDAPNTCTVHVVMYVYCARGDALAAQMARTLPRRRWTEERLRRLGGVCNVWGVRLTFLPFASAPADGVVRTPVSAACVWALRTPLITLTTRSLPRSCTAATLGPPTRLTVRIFSAVWPIWESIYICNSVPLHS